MFRRVRSVFFLLCKLLLPLIVCAKSSYASVPLTPLPVSNSECSTIHYHDGRSVLSIDDGESGQPWVVINEMPGQSIFQPSAPSDQLVTNVINVLSHKVQLGCHLTSLEVTALSLYQITLFASIPSAPELLMVDKPTFLSQWLGSEAAQQTLTGGQLSHHLAALQQVVQVIVNGHHDQRPMEGYHPFLTDRSRSEWMGLVIPGFLTTPLLNQENDNSSTGGITNSNNNGGGGVSSDLATTDPSTGDENDESQQPNNPKPEDPPIPLPLITTRIHHSHQVIPLKCHFFGQPYKRYFAFGTGDTEQANFTSRLPKLEQDWGRASLQRVKPTASDAALSYCDYIRQEDARVPADVISHAQVDVRQQTLGQNAIYAVFRTTTRSVQSIGRRIVGTTTIVRDKLISPSELEWNVTRVTQNIQQTYQTDGYISFRFTEPRKIAAALKDHSPILIPEADVCYFRQQVGFICSSHNSHNSRYAQVVFTINASRPPWWQYTELTDCRRFETRYARTLLQHGYLKVVAQRQVVGTVDGDQLPDTPMDADAEQSTSGSDNDIHQIAVDDFTIFDLIRYPLLADADDRDSRITRVNIQPFYAFPIGGSSANQLTLESDVESDLMLFADNVRSFISSHSNDSDVTVFNRLHTVLWSDFVPRPIAEYRPHHFRFGNTNGITLRSEPNLETLYIADDNQLPVNQPQQIVTPLQPSSFISAVGSALDVRKQQQIGAAVAGTFQSARVASAISSLQLIAQQKLNRKFTHTEIKFLLALSAKKHRDWGVKESVEVSFRIFKLSWDPYIGFGQLNVYHLFQLARYYINYLQGVRNTGLNRLHADRHGIFNVLQLQQGRKSPVLTSIRGRTNREQDYPLTSLVEYYEYDLTPLIAQPDNNHLTRLDSVMLDLELVLPEPVTADSDQVNRLSDTQIHLILEKDGGLHFLGNVVTVPLRLPKTILNTGRTDNIIYLSQKIDAFYLANIGTSLPTDNDPLAYTQYSKLTLAIYHPALDEADNVLVKTPKITVSYFKNQLANNARALAEQSDITSLIQRETIFRQHQQSCRYLQNIGIDVPQQNSCLARRQVLPPAKCFWLSNTTGQWQEVPYNPNASWELCFRLDSCNGGLGQSYGGCYKWAHGQDAQAVPWPLPEALSSASQSWEPLKTAKGNCFWLSNITHRWQLEASYDKHQCYRLDSCNGGLGASGGGCYKWAYSASTVGTPWD